MVTVFDQQRYSVAQPRFGHSSYIPYNRVRQGMILPDKITDCPRFCTDFPSFFCIWVLFMVILVKKDLYHEFQIDILDQSVDGMLWITVKNPNCCFNICVCYLPPENSKYCDTVEFFGKLLEKIYVYQNMGPLYLMGDYNARCGDCSDYIEDVDDVIPREVLDTYCNRNGDALIDMLIDCNMCMVNGRVGNQDFTSIST